MCLYWRYYDSGQSLCVGKPVKKISQSASCRITNNMVIISYLWTLNSHFSFFKKFYCIYLQWFYNIFLAIFKIYLMYNSSLHFFGKVFERCEKWIRIFLVVNIFFLKRLYHRYYIVINIISSLPYLVVFKLLW